jgi:hypothetical protein
MISETTQALGTAATLYGLGGALSVLLQARRMHARGTSGDVPIISDHAVGLVCGAVTLAVLLWLRRPAAAAATPRSAVEDRAQVRPGQTFPCGPAREREAWAGV